ncbi:MAG: rod shape-determining protein RodA [Geminicoccaceae bacterium]|jgi:rod shape determining protein RodA|nr:MAG: rod shape-determining protein RodA [Geminicoccaceae bacterium]
MAEAGFVRAAPLSVGEKLARLAWPLVALVLLLGLVGYALLYSAAGGSHTPWALRHGIRLATMTGLAMVIALVDIKKLFKISYPIYGVVLLLLVAVEIVGEINKGAQRWIDLGIVQLQPSELMKLALVLALARYFHAAYLDEVRRPLFLVPPVLMILLPVALVLKQPDLGTALMLGMIGTAMLFLGGVALWKFLAAGALAAAALPIAWTQLHDYQRQRVYTFLDPESDPLGAGYHIIQSKIAIGSGGLWGRGYLQGSQAQLSFLPEKHTDFAFTMLAEEAGFVGAVAVLALVVAITLAGTAIALRAESHFARLLAAGVTCNFTLYAVINVAMVTGLIPVVGVPLPLVSYGGTAMLTVMIGLGLLLNAQVNRDTPIPRFPADP